MFARPQQHPLPVRRVQERRSAGYPSSILTDARTKVFRLPANRPAVAAPTFEQSIQLASCREGLFAAFSLVYSAYLKTGLVRPNPFQMRVTPYHLLPSTDVIVAKTTDRNEVVCTLSLVGDGKLGLPIESAFAAEVAERRSRGVQLAEVTSLAEQRDENDGGSSPLLKAMGFMAQRAKRRGIDELLITVHPHHVKFYQRFIGFELLGEERPYESVLDKPAVALSLDLNLLHINHPRAYERFFGKPFSAAALADQSLSSSVRSELRRIVAVCNANMHQPAAVSNVA